MAKINQLDTFSYKLYHITEEECDLIKSAFTDMINNPLNSYQEVDIKKAYQNLLDNLELNDGKELYYGGYQLDLIVNAFTHFSNENDSKALNDLINTVNKKISRTEREKADEIYCSRAKAKKRYDDYER